MPDLVHWLQLDQSHMPACAYFILHDGMAQRPDLTGMETHTAEVLNCCSLLLQSSHDDDPLDKHLDQPLIFRQHLLLEKGRGKPAYINVA